MTAQVLSCHTRFDAICWSVRKHPERGINPVLRPWKRLEAPWAVNFHGKLCSGCLSKHWVVILPFTKVKTECRRRTSNKDPPVRPVTKNYL
jgi:hypothetical protein